MAVKYMDAAAVVLALVTCNISFISAFWGAHYCTTFFSGTNIKRPCKVQLFVIAADILLLLLYFFLEVNHQGIAQIKSVWDYFIVSVLGVSLITIAICLVFSYIIVPGDRSTYNGQEIDDEYLKFTEDVGTNKDIYIIAGDFGFLGRVPQKNIKRKAGSKKHAMDSDIKCVDVLENLLQSKQINKKCFIGSNKACQKCVISKKQLEQLVNKTKDKAVNLKILCRRPKEQDDSQYRFTIGYLLELFPNLEIRFYTEGPNGVCPDFPLRGRIIGTGQGNKKMFFHFVKKENEYQKLVTHDSTTPDGQTYIGLYSVLWETAVRDQDFLNSCKESFKIHIQNMKK